MQLTKASIQRMFQELAAMERRIQAAQDSRGGGWRLYVQTREAMHALRQAYNHAEGELADILKRALPILERRLERMDAQDAYNPITVSLHERGDVDLVALKDLLQATEYRQRLEAVAAVDELRWTSALPLLLDLLETEEHPFVISKLTKVIGHIGGHSVLKTLAPFLEHEDARIRANTVEGMADIPGDAKYPYLLELLDDPSPRVQANVALALEGMGAKEFASLVSRLVRSPEPGHRRSALYVLGKLPDAAAFAHLTTLMRDPEVDIHRHAIGELGKHGTPHAAAALAELAHETRDPDTRDAAIHALRAIWFATAEKDQHELLDVLGDLAGEVARPEATPGAAGAPDSVETLIDDLA